MPSYEQEIDQRYEQHQAEKRAARDAEIAAMVADHEAQQAAGATIATAGTTMYTSEPLPGVQSPFYAGERYYANAEDARRARLDLDEAAALEARAAAIALDAVYAALGRVA